MLVIGLIALFDEKQIFNFHCARRYDDVIYIKICPVRT